MKGKLIIFAAPSGAGKTTLVKHLLKNIDNLVFSVSATTRQQRVTEEDGKDYYFITKEEFLQKKGNGEFLESEEVYDGNYYGTLKSEVDRITQEGKNVIFDIDVQGALNIKRIYGEQALSVFVEPPSVDTLRERLQRRKSETEETLKIRLDKATEELEYITRFDTSVLNDDIIQAKNDSMELVNRFLSKDIVSQCNSYSLKATAVQKDPVWE